MLQLLPHILILLTKSMKMFKSLMLISNSMNHPLLLLIPAILNPPLLLVPASLNYHLPLLIYKMITLVQLNITKHLLIPSLAWDILKAPSSSMMDAHKTITKMKMTMIIRMITWIFIWAVNTMIKLEEDMVDNIEMRWKLKGFYPLPNLFVLI